MNTSEWLGVLNSAGFTLKQISDKKPHGLFLGGLFEFGDADGEKKAYTPLDSLEEWYAVERYLKFIDAMSHNAEIDYRTRTKGEKLEDDFYAQAGEEWRDKWLWEAIQDWWEHDPTNGYRASLQTYWLLYRDETGEYRVEKGA